MGINGAGLRGAACLGVASVEGVADSGDAVGGAHGSAAAATGRRLAVVAAVQQKYLGHALRRYALPHSLFRAPTVSVNTMGAALHSSGGHLISGVAAMHTWKSTSLKINLTGAASCLAGKAALNTR